MKVRSRYLPVSILVLCFVISVFLLAPRSEANNSPQDPPAPPPERRVRSVPAVRISNLLNPGLMNV